MTALPLLVGVVIAAILLQVSETYFSVVFWLRFLWCQHTVPELLTLVQFVAVTEPR